MKYGVVVYKETKNIGDDIQSYAAARLLPQVDYFVEREQLDVFRPKENEPVNVIMNGWYMYNKLAWPVSPCINPLYISMHFWTNDALEIEGNFLEGVGGEDLKLHEPIGCRDSETKRLLEQHGISAWLSGCLTMTLDPIGTVQKEEYVCLTDVSEDVESFLREKYPSIEFRKVFHEAENMVRQQDGWQKRFENVEELLKLYQNAKAVITTRLHCALPCLALQTPVLFVSDHDIAEQGRFEGLKELIHCSSTEELLQGNSCFDLVNPPKNPDKFLPIREKLKHEVAQFLRNNDCCTEDLKKRFDSYDGEWEKRARWKNEQLSLLQKKAIARWNKNHEAFEEMEKGRKWLENENRRQAEQIETLQRHLKVSAKLSKWIKKLLPF